MEVWKSSIVLSKILFFNKNENGAINFSNRHACGYHVPLPDDETYAFHIFVIYMTETILISIYFALLIGKKKEFVYFQIQ